jgi:hypothetical protein
MKSSQDLSPPRGYFFINGFRIPAERQLKVVCLSVSLCLSVTVRENPHELDGIVMSRFNYYRNRTMSIPNPHKHRNVFEQGHQAQPAKHAKKLYRKIKYIFSRVRGRVNDKFVPVHATKAYVN